MKILETRLYQYIDLLILRYPQLIVVKDCIVEAYQILEESYTNDGKLLVAGNGGSAADAEHIVGTWRSCCLASVNPPPKKKS